MSQVNFNIAQARAHMAEQGQAKPVFAPGWYLGRIERHSPGRTRSDGSDKVVLDLSVWERPDMQGASRDIKGHICYASRNPNTRKAAEAHMVEVADATGAGNQGGIDFDRAVGKILGVKLSVHPHRDQQGNEMTINRVDGYGPIQRIEGFAAIPQAVLAHSGAQAAPPPAAPVDHGPGPAVPPHRVNVGVPTGEPPMQGNPMYGQQGQQYGASDPMYGAEAPPPPPAPPADYYSADPDY